MSDDDELIPETLRTPIRAVYEKRLTQLLDRDRLPEHRRDHLRWQPPVARSGIRGRQPRPMGSGPSASRTCSRGARRTGYRHRHHPASTENLQPSEELDADGDRPRHRRRISAPGRGVAMRLRRQHRPAARRGRTAAGLKAAADRTVRTTTVQTSTLLSVTAGGRRLSTRYATCLPTTWQPVRPANRLVEAVTVEAIDRNLLHQDQPDPDLVIRTSGRATSVLFSAWQSAYSGDLVYRCVLARVPPRRLPACPARLRRAER